MSDAAPTVHSAGTGLNAKAPNIAARRRAAWRTVPDLIASPRLLSPLAIIVAWEVASRLGWVPTHILPAPSSIAGTFGELLWSGRLETHLLVSLTRAITGLAIGIVLGTVFALIGGLSRRGELAVDPLMQILRTLPFLGVIPLFILWFGIGETTKIALIALATKTPIYLTLYGGIRGIDSKLIEAGNSLGLGRLELIAMSFSRPRCPPFLWACAMPWASPCWRWWPWSRSMPLPASAT